MAGLRMTITVLVLTALVLSVAAGEKRRQHGSGFHDHQEPCTNDQEIFPGLPLCTEASTSTTTTTMTTTTEADEDTTDMPSALERAHWCRLPNGTYLSLGFSFLHSPCSICQCVRSRAIRCPPLQCMPTYCVDNKMPTRRAGQCCTTCNYEGEPNTCSYNNVTYPHGVIIKAIEDKMQCWCQLGHIECRNYLGSFFAGLTGGSAVFIIVIILAAVLIFGVLLCGVCTVGFYYYYKQNQQLFQQTYEQYANSAGWQPMEDGEEAVVDPAEAKRLEAEKSHLDGRFADAIPPPYAVYNDSYVPEAGEK